MAKYKMRVVCLAATKGGVGKTTLASALAVRAAQDGAKVCMIDADPQSSLEQWWALRKQPGNPRLIQVDASPEGLGLVLSEGYEWAIIDTPPAMLQIIEDAIEASDVVLIPSRASALDVQAVDEVVELCRRHGKPFAFVVNAVVTQWGKITDSAADYLRHHGDVCETRIALRKPFTAAMTIGKSGAEVDKAAAREIDALWQELQSLTTKALDAKAGAHAR